MDKKNIFKNYYLNIKLFNNPDNNNINIEDSD